MFNSALPTFNFTKILSKNEHQAHKNEKVFGYHIELESRSCVYGPVLTFIGKYIFENERREEISRVSYFIGDLNKVKPLQLLLEAFCHSSFSKKVGEMIAYSLFLDLCIENRGQYEKGSKQEDWIREKFTYIYETESKQEKNLQQNYLCVNQKGGSSTIESSTDNGINPIGMHLIMEASNCDSIIINDLQQVEDAARKAAEITGATVLHVKSHNFEHQGITSMILLSESHLTIHTWPEFNYAAIDIFTCGNHCKPMLAIAVIEELFQPGKINIREILRGPASH